MLKRDFILPAVLVLLFFLNGCMPHWSKTIRYGKTIDGPFTETVQTEVQMGLIIVPVRINGNIYRFLFDTGAMLSISQELQNEFQYKMVSKGVLTDSDNNSREVKYVQTDTLFIGNIPFIKQTAFVADFKKNPLIGCLNIDGIIGSNLMRYCQWTVDYQNAELVLSKDINPKPEENTYVLPFEFNRQFDQKVSLKLGKATISNLKIDYGSNGSLTIKNSGMDVLKEHGIVEKTHHENGYTQSGLYGKATPSKREYAWADTLYADNFMVEDVEIKTGKSALIGGEVLSRFVVTLDFENQQALFTPVPNSAPDYRTFGFRLGYSEKNGFYIQAVIDNSPADEAGLSPGLKVNKIDQLNFTNGSTFCEYADYSKTMGSSIQLEYLDNNNKKKTITIERRSLF